MNLGTLLQGRGKVDPDTIKPTKIPVKIIVQKAKMPGRPLIDSDPGGDTLTMYYVYDSQRDRIIVNSSKNGEIIPDKAFGPDILIGVQTTENPQGSFNFFRINVCRLTQNDVQVEFALFEQTRIGTVTSLLKETDIMTKFRQEVGRDFPPFIAYSSEEGSYSLEATPKV